MTLALSPVGHELLDDPGAPPAVVAESLRNIARSNRWFGGATALRWALGGLLAGGRAGELTLLDIGTGLGDLPRAAERFARRRGLRVRSFGLERSPVAARLACANAVPTVLACAGTLPLRPRAVDVVLLSQVIHHLHADAARALLAEAGKLARIGVIVLELERSALAQRLFRVGSSLLGFDPVTRADGLTSIARGYTVPELATLVRDAGAAGAHVAARPGWRVVAWWRTGARTDTATAD